MTTSACPDPFERGARIDLARLQLMVKATLGADAELQPEYYSAMTNRGVLLRLQNNIKSRRPRRRQPSARRSGAGGMLAIAAGDSRPMARGGELRTEIGEMRGALQALDGCCSWPTIHPREAIALRRNIATKLN